MDFKQVIQVCLDFAIANNATIQSYPEWEVKLAIQSRTDRREIVVDRGDLWRVDAIDKEGNKINKTKESIPHVKSKEMLLETLTRIWANMDVDVLSV